MKPLILLPTRSAVSIETMLCINEHLDGSRLLPAYRLPVVTARNFLAKRARASEEPFVLWLDDDTWFTREHVDTAQSILEANPGIDAVTSLAANRCAYSDSNAITPTVTQSICPIALQHGELARVGYCGFHFVMMRRSLLERLGDAPFNQLPITEPWQKPLRDIPGRMAEDFSFCHRVRQIGGRIVTERSIITGHVEVTDGLIYFPYRPPMVANGSGPPLPLPRDRTFRKRQRQRDYEHGVRTYETELNAA